MKLSPVSEKKIRGWTVQNFEESFPECSAVAHEWADFLSFEQKMEAQDVLSNGYYKRSK